MDIFGVPKKINRHVLKALYRMHNRGIVNPKLSDICNFVELTIKNSVPVKDLRWVIRHALRNMAHSGVIEKNGSHFCIPDPVQNQGKRKRSIQASRRTSSQRLEEKESNGTSTLDSGCENVKQSQSMPLNDKNIVMPYSAHQLMSSLAMELCKDEEDSECVFNFESDHLALRGNREYSNILRTIAILEAQKIQIHKDIENIILSKNKYLRNPLDFVSDIFNNKFIAPKCIRVMQIPNGRQSGHNAADNEDDPATHTDVKVRGRVFDQTKPETFNQLWTCEEQRRLEKLLIEYPVEPIEMRRFAKIAHALGNRTPRQVASRVQKFFKKLHSVGMPVPGRIPKNKRSILPKSKQFNKNIYRRSTFFPAYDVPVNIPEDDIYSGDPYSNYSMFDQKTNTELVLENESLGDKKKLLSMIRSIRLAKVNPKEQKPDSNEKCDNCTEAQREIRWICNTCCCCINLCSDCILYQLLNKMYLHMNHDVTFNK